MSNRTSVDRAQHSGRFRLSTPRSTSRSTAPFRPPTYPSSQRSSTASSHQTEPTTQTDASPRTAGWSATRSAGDLAGLFDGPSTVTFDPTLPMISLDLSRVTENATLISVLMTCASARI